MHHEATLKRTLGRRAWTAAVSAVLCGPASATYIVEMSRTLEYSEAVIGPTGTVAYIAESVDGSDVYRAVHKNGGAWVVQGGAYEEIFDRLIVTSTGVVAFGAYQGEKDLPFRDETYRQDVGGVYRGPSPVLPEEAGEESVRGDNVLAQANRNFGEPLGYSSDGKMLVSMGGGMVRFPGPTRCPGNFISPDRPRDYLYGTRFGTLRDRGAQDINSTFAAGYTGNQFEGFWLGMTRILRCGEQDDFSDLKANTLNYFDSVGDLKLQESGSIILQARRTLPDSTEVNGIYSVTPSGGITAVTETPALNSSVTLLGVTKGGEYFYSDLTPDGSGRGIFFSGNPNTPLVISGHQLGDYIIGGCGPGLNGYSDAGAVVCTTTVCRIDDDEDCYNAVIVADGTTDFPPDPDEPPDPDVIFWSELLGGAFDDSQNWNPELVPGSDQTAVFALDSLASVNVSFGSGSVNLKRLRVSNGTFDFLGGGVQVNEGTLAQPSLVVAGETVPDLPILYLRDGHQLQTHHAVIDTAPGSPPLAALVNGVELLDNLSNPNPQSRWDNQGRLTVDGALSIGWSGGMVSDSLRVGSAPGKQGLVEIGLGSDCNPDISIADFGETWIGYRGAGKLVIGETCNVEASGPRTIGALPGSVGEVDVFGSWVTFFSQPGVFETLMHIGLAGTGRVNVSGGMGTEALGIGVEQTGDGSLHVSGHLAAVGVSLITIVGGEGVGRLTVDGGGYVDAQLLNVGQGGQGLVTIAGQPDVAAPTLSAADGMSVGVFGGEGDVRFTDQATVVTGLARVGHGLDARGTVTIDGGAGWDIDGDLLIGMSGQGADPEVCEGDEVGVGVGEVNVLGDGVIADVTGQTLTVTGPDSRLAGTGRAVFTTFEAINCGQIAPGASPGTLTLDGKLDLRGGVLAIEMSGLASGEFDVLRVTGDAHLSGGIIRFVFRKYLPRAGDEVTFLDADGILTFANDMMFEYEGADPGFEFAVSADADGNVTFTAINDADGVLFGDGFE